MAKTTKHLEVRDISAKVIHKFPNTKNGRTLAGIKARNTAREGKHAFVYRVTETLLEKARP